MKSQDTIIVHPSNDEQITIIKAFLEALKIKFEFNKEKAYDSSFVDKIHESKQQANEGKVRRVKKENLSEFLGIK